MIRIYAILLATACVLRTQLVRRRAGEQGAVTVEQVVITAGLLFLALLVLAAIRAVVEKYVSQIQ